MLRPLLLRFFRALIGVYFRDIEAVGVPPASTRGRLLAANHVNGLIDPILVVTCAPFAISPIAKAPLFKVPVLRTLLRIADAVPVIRKQEGGGDNEAVFDRIADHFARGGNILIFPEGVSHNEPQLVPIKTGPARMLARAYERGTRGLTFQAIALEFDARDTFRSRALLVFGPVRQVDSLNGEVAAITDTLRADLEDLVIAGGTWPERRLIARVAEILAHDEGDHSLATWSSIGRQVVAAKKVLTSPAQYRAVDEAVTRYYELLERTGAREDHVVAKVPRPPGALLRAILLVTILPLAVVGFILYALPYQLPKLASRLAGKEQDVVSTYKLGIGIAAYALWMSGLLLVAFLRMPHPWMFALLIVTSAIAALIWLDRSELLTARLRARRNEGALQEARAAAVEAIARARALVT
jgi:glycerol-3-phosphate O-acyltransferase / dihydroxyacetone phosphate acyltransferase